MEYSGCGCADILTELDTGCKFNGGGGNGMPSLKSVNFGTESWLRAGILESVSS